MHFVDKIHIYIEIKQHDVVDKECCLTLCPSWIMQTQQHLLNGSKMIFLYLSVDDKIQLASSIDTTGRDKDVAHAFALYEYDVCVISRRVVYSNEIRLEP